jgi:hypothetical protein
MRHARRHTRNEDAETYNPQFYAAVGRRSVSRATRFSGAARTTVATGSDRKTSARARATDPRRPPHEKFRAGTPPALRNHGEWWGVTSRASTCRSRSATSRRC